MDIEGMGGCTGNDMQQLERREHKVVRDKRHDFDKKRENKQQCTALRENERAERTVACPSPAPLFAALSHIVCHVSCLL